MDPREDASPEPVGQTSSKQGAALREERLQQLLDNCQNEVVRQIIGPFGLTPAMFKDVDGGAVTTTHNFEQGVTANAADQARYEAFDQARTGSVDRSGYDDELRARRKTLLKDPEPIHSAYTGQELPRDGRMHLDHVRSVQSLETDSRAHLFMTGNERVRMANAPENLVPAEGHINQSMQDKDKLEWAESARKKDPGSTNAESFGVDLERLRATKAKADAYVEGELLEAQFMKQGQELLVTGGDQALRMGMRQAFGLLLHEFVQGSFKEVRVILQQRQSEANLLDQMIAALQRVMKRVVAKLEHVWQTFLEGGVQGFISNLLTYLINTLITTSAKIVTILRESLKGLWRAIKLMVNPPEGMSGMEIAREASKIITGVVTMSLGMLMEESVKVFIASVPLLAPIADVVAPALTAIITGIATALLIYGIDRLFDWLSSTGTELLAAGEKLIEAQAKVAQQLFQLLDQQITSSQLYVMAAAEYERIQALYSRASFSMEVAVIDAKEAIQHRHAMIGLLESNIQRTRELEGDVQDFLDSYEFHKK